MFDIFDRNSFNNLDNWLSEVDNHAKPNIQIIVIANKYDMVEQANEQNDADSTPDINSVPKRQVSEDDMMEFTKRTGLTIFEASAKTGTGVESSFIALTDALSEIAAQNAANSTQNNDSGNQSTHSSS